jgi:hypothetical protein
MSRSGLILVILGVVLLAHNLVGLDWAWLKTWWPLFLVALGVWSIWDHARDAGARGGSSPASDSEKQS